MTEKPLPSDEQIIATLINSMMDTAEPYPILRLLFEKEFVKEGYNLDWNKRVNENGKWVEK